MPLHFEFIKKYPHQICDQTLLGDKIKTFIIMLFSGMDATLSKPFTGRVGMAFDDIGKLGAAKDWSSTSANRTDECVQVQLQNRLQLKEMHMQKIWSWVYCGVCAVQRHHMHQRSHLRSSRRKWTCKPGWPCKCWHLNPVIGLRMCFLVETFFHCEKLCWYEEKEDVLYHKGF